MCEGSDNMEIGLIADILWGVGIIVPVAYMYTHPKSLDDMGHVRGK